MMAKPIAASLPCDPYLQWAHDTNFEGYKPPQVNKQGQRMLPFAVELKPGKKPSDLPPSAQVPKAYLEPQTSGVKLFLSRFITLTIPEDEVRLLLPCVRRLKLGLPSTPLVLFSEPLTITSREKTPVLGFIDNGIGFLNRRFWSSSTVSRIVAMWDQEESGVELAYPWRATSGFFYGRELTAANLETWLKNNHTGQSEHALYSSLGYAPAKGRFAHGTHVMDIAAGKLPGIKDPAGEAPIVAVQLPWKPFKDTSSSSLCVHILDGLRYIMRAAGKNRPVVVNISDGAYAGPQHGASLLECAMEDLLQEFKNLSIVIAAGNGRELKLHASKLGSSSKPPLLAWRVLPDVKTDSFLEVWCDSTGKKRLIEITSPQGVKTKVALGENKLLLDTAGDTIGGVYTNQDVVSNGTERALFLVALAQTQENRFVRRAAPHGIWQVKLGNIKKFDAYIQRNSPALGEPFVARQSYFVDDRIAPRYVTGEGTLNNIATGQGTVVVGAKYGRGTWFDTLTGLRTVEARYSSHGPGRKGQVQGPSVLFKSDDSPVLSGLLAAGVRTGTQVRMDGTSVAAPGVARILANVAGTPPAKTRSKREYLAIST